MSPQRRGCGFSLTPCPYLQDGKTPPRNMIQGMGFHSVLAYGAAATKISQ